MGNFKAGQRWYSEGEPELGLGVVHSIEDKQLVMQYPLAQEVRRYSIKTAPLRRFILQENDPFQTESGETYKVKKLEESNGIIFYLTEHDQIIVETQLSAKIDLKSALQRLITFQFDSNDHFLTRYKTYLKLREYEQFKHKGLIGSKLRLIPHQVYVTNKVLDYKPINAMLCDEVGLGKTIQAAIILKNLIENEIVEKALIIVPESLKHQWFAELYLKFDLIFKFLEDLEADPIQRVIIDKSELENYQTELTSIKWDIVIIDEAHQMDFSQILNQLDTNSKLLLSATPEVVSQERFFEQLSFLDSNKYQDFELFKKEQRELKEVSSVISENNFSDKKLAPYFNKDELQQLATEESRKQALVDRYGTGRIFFRNSRSNLQQYQQLFQPRNHHPIPIAFQANLSDKKVFKFKLTELLEIVEKVQSQKVLVICHSKDLVKQLERDLLQVKNFKIASFYSDQSPLERDRQSAYFSDPKGAQIMLCTEIGSEGRNFEFCQNLVLFDLPKLPDQLEQRIGRLDRIGQKEVVQIYTIYIEKTFEEVLFLIFDQVFGIFSAPAPGAQQFYQLHHEKIKEKIAHPDQLNSFIQELSEKYQAYKTDIMANRNLLVEINSFNAAQAEHAINEIEEFESKFPPAPYLMEVCERIGVKYEELNQGSIYVAPSETMYLPSFPGLRSEGQSFALTREYLLRNDHLQLLSWESPVIKGCFDIYTESELGNCSLIKTSSLPQGIYLESISLLRTVDEYRHESALYLPLTPIRVLLDAQGKNLTRDYPKKYLDENSEPLSEAEKAQIQSLPKEALKSLYEQIHQQLVSKVNQYKEKAKQDANKIYLNEIDRLKNYPLKPEDKDLLIQIKEEEWGQIKHSIEQATFDIDAVRLIVNF